MLDINVSNQHTVHLKLTECYMLIVSQYENIHWVVVELLPHRNIKDIEDATGKLWVAWFMSQLAVSLPSPHLRLEFSVKLQSQQWESTVPLSAFSMAEGGGVAHLWSGCHHHLSNSSAKPGSGPNSRGAFKVFFKCSDTGPLAPQSASNPRKRLAQIPTLNHFIFPCFVWTRECLSWWQGSLYVFTSLYVFLLVFYG